MIDLIIAFMIGLFIGAVFGVLLISLCVIQKSDDACREDFEKGEDNGDFWKN